MSSLKIEEFPGPLPSKSMLYTLTSKSGIELQVLNYGATICSLKVPDKNGSPTDIVLGFNTWSEYDKHTDYMGSTVGRTAGRIRNGQFTLPQGTTYNLSKNENGKTTLHGGFEGFNRKFWTPEIDPLNPLKASMNYKSVDGEEGYPGTLNVKVTFELSEKKPELTIYYEATVDKPCPVSLTNHSYFNLNGEHSGKNVLNHEVLISSDIYLPVDADCIPTGEKLTVENTPMDFRKMTTIGKRINDSTFEQFKITRGYDNPWMLDKSAEYHCKAYSNITGIEMGIKTTEPCVVMYTGNYLDGKLKGKTGGAYEKHYGFCMETSGVENAVNMKGFPECIVKPGEKYEQVTTFSFAIKT